LRVAKSLLPLFLVFGSVCVWPAEPKQKPENTIHVDLSEPVKPQTFPKPITFFVDKVIDRSGAPQPHLLTRGRGGIFIDQEPTDVVRTALEASLKSGNALAVSKDAADYVLDVYLFHFGLAEGTGLELYGKVELNIVMKSRSGKSQQITALGTSLGNTAVRKKNIQKNLEASLEQAIQGAVRNFLRGTQLRDAVAADAQQPVADNKESSHD
jgi:hypothetical protein